MDDKQRSRLDFPQFSNFIPRNCERPDEPHPVIDGKTHELPQISIQDVLKARDNSPQRTVFKVLGIVFEEVVVFSKFVLNFTNQKLSPLNQNVLRN